MNREKKDYASDVMSHFMGRPFKWIVLFISVFFIALPLYWLFSNSVKMEKDYLANPPVIVPLNWTLDNFQQVFATNGVALGLFNSVFVAAASTMATLFLGSLAAYSIVKGKLPNRVRHLFIFWFLVQRMYPAIATAIPIYLVMREFGLIDTKVALVIMNTSFNLPLVIWLMIGFFQEVPKELEEAGMIDGCNMWQRYFRIVLPITRPGLIAAAILTFVASWNEFLFAVILSVKSAKTLPVIIAGFITDRGLEWGPMAAMGVIIVMPVVFIVFSLQKHFVRGLSAGAVKE